MGPRVASRLPALVFLVLVVVGALALIAVPAGADSPEVSITDTGFGPPTLQVSSGSTVSWTNDGNATHDVTSDDGTFQSGPLSPGQSWTHQFDTAGTFTYRSTIDANITGAVVVTGAAVGAAQAATPFAEPSVPAAPAATPAAMAYTGAAETAALAVLGTVALLLGYAIVTGTGLTALGAPFGGAEPWRILALVDPRRLGFTDELLPRGRWRRAPRRSREADLLPGRAHPMHRVETPERATGATRGSSARRSRRRRSSRRRSR